MKVIKRSATTDVFGKLREQEDSTSDDPPQSGTGDSSSNISDTSPDIEDSDTTEVSDDAPDDGDDADADAESTTDGTDTNAADNQTHKPSRRERLLARLPAVMAGIVLVAALGLAGYLGWQLKQQDDTAAAGRAALDAAQKYAVILASVDAKDVDKNFAQTLDGATGTFKDMYSKSSAQLRQLLIDNNAVSHGNVVDAAVKSATKSKVEVLLFVDQSITNKINPEPRIDRMRIEVTMELIDGRWLASNVVIS